MDFDDLVNPRFRKPFEINFAEITSDDIKAMQDEEIIQILTGEKDMGGAIDLGTRQVLTNELMTRSIKRASKPHWSVMPSFWLLVATVVLTALAIVVAGLPQVQKLLTPEKPAYQPIQPVISMPSNLQQQKTDSQPKSTNQQQK
jgi:hypothetical protein